MKKSTSAIYSFDSTAFPDGDYRVRVTASDAPSNTPEEALSTSEVSDVFTIDNTPAAHHQPEVRSRPGVVEWHAADELSDIRKAEYSLDGGDWTMVDPAGRLSDSQSLDYSLTLKNLGGGRAHHRGSSDGRQRQHQRREISYSLTGRLRPCPYRARVETRSPAGPKFRG